MRAILIVFILILGLLDGGLRLIVGGHGGPRPSDYTGTVRIAFVSGLSGSDATAGQEMRRAVEDAVAQRNAAAGVGGLRVELQSFDDGNDPERARAVARQIAADPSIVAVIGHRYSSASLAAGPVYAEAGLPALTPASTNPRVTAGNPWYFSTIYNDDVQGAFLAYYAGMELGGRQLAILAEPDPYATRLSAVVREEAGRRHLPVAYEWRGDPAAADGAAQLAAMTAKVAALPKDTVVVLAAHMERGAQMVRSLRDAGIGLRILGPDALGTMQFANGFAALGREQTTPGFYTNGVYVSVPFMGDIGNSEARALLHRLGQSGPAVTTWGAPYAYDAAKVLMEAMRRAGFGPKAPANARQAIRDQLALMRSPAQGVPGATGVTWFDDGNAAHKPITIGQFSGRLISSLIQLRQAGGSPDLSPVPVVYTGLSLHRIERNATDHGQLDVDFDLWFRFQGDVPVEDIAFDGALAPIALGKPVDSAVNDGVQYRLYAVHGSFRADTAHGHAAQGRLGLPITFHHRSLPQDRLIYVPDSTALPDLSGPPLAQRLGQGAVMPEGYRLMGAALATDTLFRSTLGNPRLAASGGNGQVGLPGLSLLIDLGPDATPLRRQWLTPAADMAALVLAALFAGLLMAERRRPLLRWSRLMVPALLLTGGGLLLTGENAAIRLLVDLEAERWTPLIIRGFDLAWWLASAALAMMALNRLLWAPLEARSGRPVPQVLKTFLGALVVLATAFGIISNVFERDVTGLIATSGVVAMIIGLALQSNLSNIFSGIALNIERPMRPGDWVKIGDAAIAQVIDISWRATQVKTHVNTVLSIPNAVVTAARIENYSHPEPYFVLEQWLHVDPEHDPARVCDLLADALSLVEPVDGRERLGLAHVGYAGVDARGGNYIVRYDCVDMGLFGWLSHVVTLGIDQVLRQAGISMTTGRSEIHLHQGAAEQMTLVPEAATLLAGSELLAGFSEDDRARLAEAARRRNLAGEERLYAQGDAAGSLYVLATGVIVLRRGGPDGRSQEVARLGSGAVFGEEVMATDPRRTESAEAIGRVMLYEIDRAVLLALAERDPQLWRALTGHLAARRAAASPVQADGPADAPAPARLMGKMRSLFAGS